LNEMLRNRQIANFLYWFALVYVLLLLPWPGFREAYSAYFRRFGGMVFAGENVQSEVTFEPAGPNSLRPKDTRVVIVNKALMNYDGSGPVRNLNFDAVAVGWRPLALLAALIIATPISWRRRIRALAFGTFGLHAFLLLFLGVAIWNEATEVSLVTLTPFWKSVASGFKAIMTSQLNLCLPVLIWVLVTFRAADRIVALSIESKDYKPEKCCDGCPI